MVQQGIQLLLSQHTVAVPILVRMQGMARFVGYVRMPDKAEALPGNQNGLRAFIGMVDHGPTTLKTEEMGSGLHHQVIAVQMILVRNVDVTGVKLHMRGFTGGFGMVNRDVCAGRDMHPGSVHAP